MRSVDGVAVAWRATATERGVAGDEPLRGNSSRKARGRLCRKRHGNVCKPLLHEDGREQTKSQAMIDQTER